MQKLALYIHIPFCYKKCPYCDFTSYVYEKNQVSSYHELLQKEIDLHLQAVDFSSYQIESIYFGGGTPTTLEALTLCLLLNYIRSKFSVAADCEITLEANPGSSTINLSFLAHLRLAGFNRISLGCQSFNDSLLESMGRLHNSADTIKSIFLARQAGFENISLDLIYALPVQSLSDWKDSLRQAIKLSPQHISTYSLTLEKGTPFYEKWKKKEIELPDDEIQLKMYDLAMALLPEAGYDHYEISNFSLPDWRSKHNQIYWKNEEYLSLGAGASSYLNGERSTNHKGLKEYSVSLSEKKLPVAFEEKITGKKLMGETLMLGLRMIEGVNLKNFQKRFNADFHQVYSELIPNLLEEKLIILDRENLRLTKRGIIFSNEVFTRFLA